MRTRSISTVVMIRALAILLVVANHAFPERLHGGMNVLLVISGLSMAQFAFTAQTRDTLHAFLRFGKNLLAPSLLVALASAFWSTRFEWTELLLFSNWITTQRVSLFPIWYTQCILQMILVLAVMFWAMNLTPLLRKHPRGVVLLLFGAAVGLAAFGLMHREPGSKLFGLPHLLAWHFLFGWVMWAYLHVSVPTFGVRIGLTFVHLASSALLLLILESDMGLIRFCWMSLLITPLLWTDRLRLPVWLAQPLNLLSQSTLAIFLLHYVSFALALEFVQLLPGPDPRSIPPSLRLAAGVLLPMASWIIWHALLRVYRRNRRHLEGPMIRVQAS